MEPVSMAGDRQSGGMKMGALAEKEGRWEDGRRAMASTRSSGVLFVSGEPVRKRPWRSGEVDWLPRGCRGEKDAV
jgi:hypothetical protein